MVAIMCQDWGELHRESARLGRRSEGRGPGGHASPLPVPGRRQSGVALAGRSRKQRDPLCSPTPEKGG